MDIVDHWISVYGLAVVGLLECIVAGWMFDLDSLRLYLNEVSDFAVGRWWNFCIRWVTPLILVVMFARSIHRELTTAYGGYPAWSLWVGGWLITAVLIALSLFLHLKTDGRLENLHKPGE